METFFGFLTFSLLSCFLMFFCCYAHFRQVIVRVNPSLSPSLHIHQHVLSQLEESIAKRETIKALSLVIGSALYLVFQPEIDNIKRSLVNDLATKTSFFEPAVIRDVNIITNAFNLLRQSVNEASDVGMESRRRLLDSLLKLVEFSRIFADEGISLQSKSHSRMVFLLSDNFDFDQLSATNINNNYGTTVNPSYATLQSVYNLVAMNLASSEKHNFTTQSIDAVIYKKRRRTGNSLMTSSSPDHNTTGNCVIEYEMNLRAAVIPTGDITEITECSLHNPYAETSSKSSIVSLTFQDELRNELKIKNLPQNESVVLRLPITYPYVTHKRNDFQLRAYELVYIDLKEALPSTFQGETNKVLFVSMNITNDGVQKGALFVHLSDEWEPKRWNTSTVVDVLSIEGNSNQKLRIKSR